MPRKSTPQKLRQSEALEFVELCRGLDIAPPAALVRGLELLDAAEAFHTERPLASILDLDDAEIGPLITDLAIRHHAGRGATTPDGLGAGVDAFTEKLLAEMCEHTLPDLDRIVVELRPQFDELARPLIVAAQEPGFTSATTSDDLITWSAAAIEAWRALRSAEATLEPLAGVWRAMTEIFAVEPTRATSPRRSRTTAATA
jgi:hypothetical protein